MSINIDSYLDSDQKRSVLSQRLQQFAVEAYQHQLNKKVAHLAEDAESASQSEKTLELIANAIKVYQDELDALPEPVVAE
jgi:hypothetical protein